jgi:hypothetical protein
MVVLAVVGTELTAGNYTAFRLLDASRLTVEVAADNLAHSSDKVVAAAVEVIEV